MTKLFDTITAEIISAIEDDAAEYRMPWHAGSGMMPHNAASGRAYRGINVLVLWGRSRAAGFSEHRWATYRQWTEIGGQVRRGERGTNVLLWKPIQHGGDDTANDEPSGHTRSIARAFIVFNAAQVDGLRAPDPAQQRPMRDDQADAFFERFDHVIWRGSDSAFYDRASDTVSMPSFNHFVSSDAYYAVLGHELTHWTGAKHRLDRDLTGRFGDQAYAMEELVAELGAAFTVGHLGLNCSPRHDHAPYIASWLKVLGSDPRAIITAASKAQAAADYLIGGETSACSPVRTALTA